jgi:hypothetical protein
MRRRYESYAGLSRERRWQSIPKGRHEKSEDAQAPSPVGLSGVVPQRPPPPTPDPPEPDVLGGLAPPYLGCWRICGQGLRSGDGDAGKQRRACEQAPVCLFRAAQAFPGTSGPGLPGPRHKSRATGVIPDAQGL